MFEDSGRRSHQKYRGYPNKHRRICANCGKRYGRHYGAACPDDWEED